jgi:hypothetical protein
MNILIKCNAWTFFFTSSFLLFVMRRGLPTDEDKLTFALVYRFFLDPYDEAFGISYLFGGNRVW